MSAPSSVFIAALLSQNILLVQYLAAGSFVGVLEDEARCLKIGLAVIVVSVAAAAVTWPIYRFALVPLHLEDLALIVFMLVIAGLVASLGLLLQRRLPSLERWAGRDLALLSADAIVLAIALTAQARGYDFVTSVVSAAGASVGFLLALLLLAGARSRVDMHRVPSFLRGAPIVFVAASILSLAFVTL